MKVEVRDDAVEIVASAETTAQTGVEMEALTAASVAALTVYDMAKAVSPDLVVASAPPGEDEGARVTSAAVLTVSDGVARGVREDRAATFSRLLAGEGFDVVRRVVPDDRAEISSALRELARSAAVILTTGGTGVAPRDVTPEATERRPRPPGPGIAEAIRADAVARTPHGLLSRGLAGMVGSTLVVNLPGSTGGVRDGSTSCGRARPRRRAPRRRGDRAPPDVNDVLRYPRLFASLVKVEHTVFALPFAYVGAFLAVDGVPSGSDLLWITVAMVGARSLAMALNRLIDAELDARNPRTAGRELPRGALSPRRGRVLRRLARRVPSRSSSSTRSSAGSGRSPSRRSSSTRT